MATVEGPAPGVEGFIVATVGGLSLLRISQTENFSLKQSKVYQSPSAVVIPMQSNSGSSTGSSKAIN